MIKKGKLRKKYMEKVTILEIPSCKMVSSNCGMFGDGTLERFDEWFSQFERPLFPKDFLWYDSNQEGFVWYYIYDPTMNVPKEFEVIDFQGGLYAIATGIDNQDTTEVFETINEFINSKKNIEIDQNRAYLGNIITSPMGEEVLGYNQMVYYVPIKKK